MIAIVLGLACGACASPGAGPSIQADRAEGRGDWQAVAVVSPGEATLLRHRCRRIPGAEATAMSPLALKLKPIAEDDVFWRILGVLEYRGQGVEISSDDPRFASLAIAPGHTLPRTPAGDFVQVDVYVPFGPETEAAHCLAPWNPTDVHPDIDLALAPPPAITAAFEAQDHLRLISAAPVGRSRWIALMAAEGQTAGRALVWADANGAESQVVAHLPVGFQLIQPVLDPHSARRWVRLVGRDTQGPIRVVILEVPASLH